MKKFIISLVLLICFFPIFSDSAGFGDIFSDDNSIDVSTTEEKNEVEFTGETGINVRSFIDDEWDSELLVTPYFNLELNPYYNNIDAIVRLNFAGEYQSIKDSGTNFSFNSNDIIDELYLRLFFDFGYIEAGLMKVEWGKGDGYHVMDPINPLDQSKGIFSDINEMKKSVNLIKLNIYTGLNGLFEIVYIPIFQGYSIAEEGRWALIDPSSLPNLTIEEPGGLSGSTAALRYTTTISSMDLGFQYYYGYKPEPGYKFESVLVGADPMDPASWEIHTTKLYTKAHLFGLEAAWATGPFTFRTEAGYWLTEDTDGDKPEYWNSSIVFLGGFDVMVPSTDIFFSFQLTESYIINYEDRGPTDINTGSAIDNKPTTTNLIGAVEIPIADDMFNLRLAGLYLVEGQSWLLFPSLTWYPFDNSEITLETQLFGGEKSTYLEKWKDNGSISLKFKYLF